MAHQLIGFYSIADGIRDGNVLGFDPYMVCTYRDKDVRKAVALEQAKAGSVEEALADTRKSEIFYYYMDISKVPMGPMEDRAGNRVKGIEDFLTTSQYAPETPFGTIRYYRKPHTMKGFIDAAVKLYSGDRPLALFANKLPENIAGMNARFAEIDVVVEGGMTLRDYITLYARRAKDAQLLKVVEAFGVDQALLEEMCALDLSEATINEYGRFDRLKDSIDKAKAKAFLEGRTGEPLLMYKVNMESAKILRRYILEGGFDIDQ